MAAGDDRVVKTEAERAYAKRLPNASYVEIKGAEHEILMERDEVREQFWTMFDAFVNGQVASNRQ